MYYNYGENRLIQSFLPVAGLFLLLRIERQYWPYKDKHIVLLFPIFVWQNEASKTEVKLINEPYPWNNLTHLHFSHKHLYLLCCLHVMGNLWVVDNCNILADLHTNHLAMERCNGGRLDYTVMVIPGLGPKVSHKTWQLHVQFEGPG